MNLKFSFVEIVERMEKAICSVCKKPGDSSSCDSSKEMMCIRCFYAKFELPKFWKAYDSLDQKKEMDSKPACRICRKKQDVKTYIVVQDNAWNNPITLCENCKENLMEHVVLTEFTESKPSNILETDQNV